MGSAAHDGLSARGGTCASRTDRAAWDASPWSPSQDTAVALLVGKVQGGNQVAAVVRNRQP